MHQNLTKVAFVYLCQDEQVLLLQEGGRLSYGLWCLPGGHVDEGESLEQAAVREAEEESGYKVILEEIIYQGIISKDEYKGCRGDTEEIELYIYKAKIVGGELRKDEQALDLKWHNKNEALILPLRWALLKGLIEEKCTKCYN